MLLGLGLDLVLHILQGGVLGGDGGVLGGYDGVLRGDDLGLTIFQSGDDSVVLGYLLHCGHILSILLMMDDLAPLLLYRDDDFLVGRDRFDCDIVCVLPQWIVGSGQSQVYLRG